MTVKEQAVNEQLRWTGAETVKLDCQTFLLLIVWFIIWFWKANNVVFLALCCSSQFRTYTMCVFIEQLCIQFTLVVVLTSIKGA